MKTIILSDIHGNLEALEAVLKEIKKHPGARIFSLGDIVGYGANPIECIERVRKIAHISLCGNHDHTAVKLDNLDYFNPYARDAIQWTSRQLTDEDRQYLAHLPLYMESSDRLFLTHSTPLYPEQWQYIFTRSDAAANFSVLDTQICFIGHSHVPMIIESNPEGILFDDAKPSVYLKDDCKYIINVGSVGQPRDGDWRACFLLYDDKRRHIEFKRLEYDVHAAQTKILEQGLPHFLAERLSYGR